MRLKILTKDDPVVRSVARPVDPAWLKGPEAQRLIADMIETMRAANGIGLAAPQIGRAIQLVTIAHRDGALVLANPEIRRPSRRQLTEEEGCLSVPGVFGLVARHERLTVHFLDTDGQPRSLEATGLLARVVQHEVDHLHGTLAIDRTNRFTAGRP